MATRRTSVRMSYGISAPGTLFGHDSLAFRAAGNAMLPHAAVFPVGAVLAAVRALEHEQYFFRVVVFIMLAAVHQVFGGNASAGFAALFAERFAGKPGRRDLF